MKLGALVVLLVAVLVIVNGYAQSETSCPRAGAKAFISIRHDPPYLVGTIPSRFTAHAIYFSRRFNCRGQSALVRRVDTGIYDIRFPGLDPITTIATATSDEGISAAALPIGDATVRISLRGPLVLGEVVGRRDVPFSVVIY